MIKHKVATQNVGNPNLKSLIEVTKQAISKITSADWSRGCTQVKSIENDSWRRDTLIEDEMKIIKVDIDLEANLKQLVVLMIILLGIDSATETADSDINPSGDSSTETADQDSCLRYKATTMIKLIM
ncbi:hypothetical protein L9F63_004854 [Diploptera punctata]|uniref:Uncharacterized protein n=1 Tax=Diploptera punctata TaxID=6984 RepID=A0AAD7ZEV5_DIPPU|nr:hypothetical protein L9F63_004854 [Diploptera punctata]